MAYAYSDESNKHLMVRFECDRMNRCPSSSCACYTSSSCSSTSHSSMEEPYDIDNAHFDLSPEPNQPDLTETPAPFPSPEVRPQTTQCPQIPMPSGRPSGYDPNRLPPAMFAAKPSSAMDWSLASNESLFSIHVGNSSFSKDQYSSELGKLDEMVETLEADRHSVETRSDILEEENFDINIVTGNVEKEEENKETIRLPTIEEIKGFSAFSRHSDESNHSNQSFQFPVLAGHHDHNVKDTLKQEKEEMRAPEKQQYQPEEKGPERNAPLKATESNSWLSCFCCCWICR